MVRLYNSRLSRMSLWAYDCSEEGSIGVLPCHCLSCIAFLVGYAFLVSVLIIILEVRYRVDILRKWSVGLIDSRERPLLQLGSKKYTQFSGCSCRNAALFKFWFFVFAFSSPHSFLLKPGWIQPMEIIWCHEA